MAEELIQMSLINNLPDELLILQFKSFLNVMARSFAPQDVRTRELDISSLLLLTRVCRRWRDLVIGFPAFWTRVDNDNIDEFDEFTRRSRDLPLSLRLTIKEHISDASTILRSYGQRIRRLTFALSLESCDITPLLDQAVPNHLECLIIAYNDHSESDDMPLAYRHLNPHICSSLSALSLRPATSWFPVEARFPNLTHLYLSAADTFFGIGGILNKPPLFPLLKKTPKLEFLHIVRPQALNLNSLGAVTGSGTVVLPKLRSCVLVGGDVDSCFSIISQCSMPRNVWIRLDQVLRFNNDLLQLPSLPMKNQITHLEVSMHLQQFHVRAEAPMGGVWLNTNLDDSHLINDTDVWRSWLCSLLETSVFPNLTSLHIDGIDSSTLAPLLRSTPQVTHLGVRLRTTWCDEPHRPGGPPQDHEFIHALGSLDQDTGTLLLPALESLAFDALHRHIWLDPEDVDDYSVGADAIAPNPSLETSPGDISASTTASRIGKPHSSRPQITSRR